VEMTVGTGKFVDRKGSDGHRENLIIHLRSWRKHCYRKVFRN